MRCDRGKPYFTCLKCKPKLYTHQAFWQQGYSVKPGSGFGVFDPGFTGDDAELPSWEVPEKIKPAALSRSDRPVIIARTGKWDGLSSDPEVKTPMTISDHAQQA